MDLLFFDTKWAPVEKTLSDLAEEAGTIIDRPQIALFSPNPTTNENKLKFNSAQLTFMQLLLLLPLQLLLQLSLQL